VEHSPPFTFFVPPQSQSIAKYTLRFLSKNPKSTKKERQKQKASDSEKKGRYLNRREIARVSTFTPRRH
jgi:hypothetical protein